MEGINLIQKQNIFWTLRISKNKSIWVIEFFPLKTIDPNVNAFKYQSPNIVNTYPGINENIELSNQVGKNLQFIINYKIPVSLSIGNLTIYQYDKKNNTLLRQLNFGQDINYCQKINDTAISIEVLTSTFHQVDAKFGIKVENNFVKSQITQEPLFGISEEIWTFTTSLKIPEKPADRLTLSIQLKFDDKSISYYEEIISKESNTIDQLKSDLSKAIPIEQSRLIIDNKIQNVNTETEGEKRIILSITILPPANNDGTERNTDSTMKDLNELIKNKRVNSLSQGNITRFLDENYGTQLIPDFWERYYIPMIIVAIAVVILGAIVFLARRKYPAGKNFSIIKIVLIIYDLVFDIAFLLTNANDIHNLFIISLLSIIVPIFFNMSMALYALIHEILHNKEFIMWCKQNELITSVITVISCADIEALNVISSKIAGLKIFSAPSLSEKVTKLIFWISFMNIFLEDIPQFIIQVYYQKSVIVYTIIPTLSLLSSFVTLCIGIVGKIYFIFINFQDGKRESEKLRE